MRRSAGRCWGRAARRVRVHAGRLRRAVRFGRVDAEWPTEVGRQQVVLGEAEVKQSELLSGSAGFGAHDQSGQPDHRIQEPSGSAGAAEAGSGRDGERQRQDRPDTRGDAHRKDRTQLGFPPVTIPGAHGEEFRSVQRGQ
jgi:hypothetical protein